MKIIYLIIGLPGSGKTTLMKKFKRVFIIDDIKDISELPNNDTKRIAISDPYLCRNEHLKKACWILEEKYPDHKIKIIEFENDKEKALKNATKRKHKKVDNLIERLSKNYSPKNKYTLSIKTS